MPQGRGPERREREGDNEWSRDEEEEEGFGMRRRGGWMRRSEAAYASSERKASFEDCAEKREREDEER